MALFLLFMSWSPSTGSVGFYIFILGLANTLICDAVISSALRMSIALARVRSASFSS